MPTQKDSFEKWWDWISCGISEPTCNTIGTVITIVLSILGVGLLLTGSLCHFHNIWMNNGDACIYILGTGAIITLSMGSYLLIYFGIVLADRSLSNQTINPIRVVSSNAPFVC